jgi:hypothetical protein
LLMHPLLYYQVALDGMAGRVERHRPKGRPEGRDSGSPDIGVAPGFGASRWLACGGETADVSDPVEGKPSSSLGTAPSSASSAVALTVIHTPATGSPSYISTTSATPARR